VNNLLFYQTSHGQRSQSSKSFFSIYIYMEWIYSEVKKRCLTRLWNIFWFHQFFSKKKKTQKNEILLWFVVCSYFYVFVDYILLWQKISIIIITFIIIIIIIIIIIWFLYGKRYIGKILKHYLFGAVYRKRRPWYFFFNSLYLSIFLWNQKYKNFPIGQCYGWYPQTKFLRVPTVTYNYIYGVSWTKC